MLRSEDHALLGQLRSGSKDALRQIYARYSRELFTIGVSLLGDADMAEDCLQDVFVELAAAAHRVRIRRNLKAYLAACIVNRARDRMRRTTRQVTYAGQARSGPDSVRDPVEQLIADEQASALLAGIGQLPGVQREAFVLHAQADLTFREIAGIQGVSVRTVHSRYRYAVERLRQWLGERVAS